MFTSAELAPRVREALDHVERYVQVVVIDPDATSIFEVQPRCATGAGRRQRQCAADVHLGHHRQTQGLRLVNRSVIAGGEFTSSAHRLGAADRVLCAMPLYHINGQIVTTVAPLVHGGSVVMPHRFSASNYWSLAVDYRCTWINVVPTIIAYLLNGDDPRTRRLDISHIKLPLGFRPASAEQHRAFEAKFGIGVIETFGMTETNAPCFTNPYEPALRKIGSPARPMATRPRPSIPRPASNWRRIRRVKSWCAATT